MASPLFSGSKSALSNMEMHAFPPLHIPPKGNHSWFDQKVKKNKIMMILPTASIQGDVKMMVT